MRWRRGACVIVGVLGLTGCTTGSGSAHDAPVVSAPSVTVRPERTVTMRPVADYGTVLDDDRRSLAGWAAPQVEVGFTFTPGRHAGAAVLQFGPVAVRSTCITRATLHVTLASPAPSLAVRVYPGDPAKLAHAPGDALPRSGMLLDNRPRGLVVADGTSATADVTALVRTWAAGGPFPSQGLAVEPGAPLALVVQPEHATSPETFRLATTESGPSTAPTLVLSAHC